MLQVSDLGVIKTILKLACFEFQLKAYKIYITTMFTHLLLKL